MKYCFIVLLLNIGFFSFTQEKFQVKDLFTNENIPFVKVIPSNESPRIADIDGYFELNRSANTSITVKYTGYHDTLIDLSQYTETVIFLTPTVQQVEEVVVTAGENPAHRIMKIAIENRKKNDPSENNAFQYDSYSKLFFAIDPSILDSFPPDSQDTNYLKAKKTIETSHLFLVESTTSRKFMPPNKNKEIINSYKVSGFNDPLFSTIFNEMQSFSFYENQFEILGKAYINPIAFGGINRYLFILEDTTVSGNDTTFTISFRPRKGKNFDGMKGQLFINTNGYAIEKVIAEPYEKSLTFDIKIIQEYKFLEGKKWFPVKLSTEMSMLSVSFSIGDKAAHLMGKGSSYISNIVIDPPLSRRDFDQIAIETAPDAGDKKDKDWDSLRIYHLTDQEKNTYRIVDSVAKEEHFDRYLYAAKVLASGKIPMGKFNMDIRRIYTYNKFEGNRFGTGIETSDKLMKRITIGGFFGYGLKDKVFKYGGFSEFNLYPKKNLFLELNYQFDAFERGGNLFHRQAALFSTNELARRLYIQNMDYQRLAEVDLKGFLLPRIQFHLFGNYQRIFLAGDYRFIPQDSSVFMPNTDFDLAEAGLEVSWQFKEQIIQLGYKRVSLGSKYPLLTFKTVVGKKGIFESNYDYLRLNACLSQNVSLRGIGKLVWQINLGKTFGSVPLFLMQVGPGSNGQKGKVSVINTFETMAPSSFYCDQQINIFTRFTLLAWKSKLKWTAPQLSFHHAIGYGSMKNPAYHSNAFQSMDKGYYEAGIILDKLYLSGASGFGVGVFAPYGRYSVPQFEKNLVFKLSVSFGF